MTTYTAPDLTGTGSHVRVTFTDTEQRAFGDMLETLFSGGVERFGSVEAFGVALDRYNAERRAMRNAGR